MLARRSLGGAARFFSRSASRFGASWPLLLPEPDRPNDRRHHDVQELADPGAGSRRAGEVQPQVGSKTQQGHLLPERRTGQSQSILTDWVVQSSHEGIPGRASRGMM
jgi:hypothetical protein